MFDSKPTLEQSGIDYSELQFYKKIWRREKRFAGFINSLLFVFLSILIEAIILVKVLHGQDGFIFNILVTVLYLLPSCFCAYTFIIIFGPLIRKSLLPKLIRFIFYPSLRIEIKSMTEIKNRYQNHLKSNQDYLDEKRTFLKKVRENKVLKRMNKKEWSVKQKKMEE